jgi:oleate hydratase
MAKANHLSASLTDALATAPKVYMAGGGIASMAAAVFMIRDGNVFGRNITIFEESDRVGGNLECAGCADHGYVLRGGMMLESKDLCTFGLFASVPTLGESETVTEETLRWNETMKAATTSCLFRDGHRQTVPKLGLSEKHILTMESLVLRSEIVLGRTSIAEQFDTAFLQTDFWFLWCTTFAFQPWHSAVEFKRSLVRFADIIDGFGHLRGVMHTVYNQYDSLVRPLENWLKERGVKFEMKTRITDLEFALNGAKKTVQGILFQRAGVDGAIAVSPADYVLVTLAAMTDGYSLGTMDTAPLAGKKGATRAWPLWETIADGRPAFGQPAVFTSHAERVKSISFTMTLSNPALLQLLSGLTRKLFGQGGIITFPDSSWLVSVFIPHQPHVIGQLGNVDVVWGYGLTADQPGNFVFKPMGACSGRDIMIEVLGHLRIQEDAAAILESCICIPCLMPFITSQYLPREKGDRPPVIPDGSHNLAFMGQFCEVPDEVVFSVEYSIRSAQLAVYGLLDLQLELPPVYHGRFDPRVHLKAFRALHEIAV